MRKNQSYMTDMTEGEPLKVMVHFALPLVVAAVVQQLFSLTDAMILGRYGGDGGLAVLGVCSWPIWFQVSVLTNFGQASCLLTAVRFGAKKEDDLKRAIGNVYFVSFFIGLIMILGLPAVAKFLLRIQGAPVEVFDDALLYLQIIYSGTVFLLIYNTLSSLMRALGDSFTSFQAIMVSAVVNVVLDFILVSGFHMGVRGAAIATTASQMLAALICVMKIRKYSVLQLKKSYLKPDKGLLKEYKELCIPMMAQSIVIAAGGVYVQAHINQYGGTFAAGVSASGKIFSVVETGAIALASASASFISQNVGAKRFDRIQVGVKQICGLSEITAIVIAIFLLFSGKYILAIYVTDEAMVYALGNIKVYCAGLLIMYPMYTLRQAVQALGNTRIPLVAALLQLVMRIVTVSILPIFIGSSGIYFSSFSAWLVSLIFIAILYPTQFQRCKRRDKESKMSTLTSKT